MNHQFLTLLFIIILGNKCFAQINTTVTTKINTVTPKTITYEDLTVYEFNNKGGASGKISSTLGILKLPIPNITRACIEVAPGKIAYLRYNSGGYYEVALTGLTNNVALAQLIGIRFDDLSSFNIVFNGLSTSIHNADCARMSGKITIKVVETAPDNIDCFFKANTGDATRGTGALDGALTYMPYNKATNRSPEIYNNIVHNSHDNTSELQPNIPDPVINSMVTLKSGGDNFSSYQVGRSAIRDGRVKILITTDLNSEHKMGDFSADYVSNIKMAAPITEAIPINLIYGENKLLNRENPKIVCGPYNAFGTYRSIYLTLRQGKKFRAHFTVTGL